MTRTSANGPNPDRETQESPSTRVKSCSAPKWAAIVNDKLIPMPDKHVKAQVIVDQAGLQFEGIQLFRDHNSPNDPIIEVTEDVNLSKGNVFYTKQGCHEIQQGCKSPAKRAFIIDDKWKITLLKEQTRESLLRLFGLGSDIKLIRDLEGSDKAPITVGAEVKFSRGNVFTTACADTDCRNLSIGIIVNGRQRDINACDLCYDQVVQMAFPRGASNSGTIHTVTYSKGHSQNPEGSMVSGDCVKTQTGMIFNVTCTNKS